MLVAFTFNWIWSSLSKWSVATIIRYDDQQIEYLRNLDHGARIIAECICIYGLATDYFLL
ncbi:hypothetical protein [Scytonema sp. HK-05]|uniref:hypothetical protein n=1 Tax=Scytonema sp. HK-05 TaxID=1137095 RepID=UPI0009365941|nr:hypothetical protein [Scytonema sp. HK-05]OKH54366.1 hypothetical protein NIES2130_28750 [Scytonema sp. HK-05]